MYVVKEDYGEMNAVIENIKKRRSIRRYLPEQIKETELNEIIEAGTYAPSAHNEQSWHFTVVQNKELIDFISVKTKESMAESEVEWIVKMSKNEKLHIFYNAPTVIIVSGKEEAFSSIVDCSAATQNMILAAESLDIGSCWNGLIKYFFKYKDEMSKLNIPEGYTPFYAVSFGYKQVSPTRPIERKKNVVNYIK